MPLNARQPGLIRLMFDYALCQGHCLLAAIQKYYYVCAKLLYLVL